MSKKVAESFVYRDPFLCRYYGFGKNVDLSIPDVEYDDIVDTSHYDPNSNSTRDFMASGTAGAGMIGDYDYESDEDLNDDSKRPTDLVLALRSGKLDKADVQMLKEVEDENLIKLADKKLLEAEDKSFKDRQKRLDKALGIDEDTVQPTMQNKV